MNQEPVKYVLQSVLSFSCLFRKTFRKSNVNLERGQNTENQKSNNWAHRLKGTLFE